MSTCDNYPRITVVIPSFNQGQYIEETLLSVLGQGYPQLEVIVIDGGSTDNTVEVLKKYSNQLTYWHSQKDNGQADAINQGMRLSSGNVLCWLNSDDMYLPGTLLEVGKHFSTKVNECYLMYGSAIVMNQSEGQLQSSAATTAPFDALKLIHFDYIVQPSSFWTRKLWEKTGELDVDYHYVLDWEWFIRASQCIEFEYSPKFYSIYRWHSQHKTSTGEEKRRAEILKLMRTFASDYWIELYEETEKCYQPLMQARNFLQSCKIPRAHWFMPILFPQFLRKIKNPQDFLETWVMLGF